MTVDRCRTTSSLLVKVLVVLIPCFQLVHQCNINLQPGGRKFIRSVTFETGNCCILSTDSQLENVVRFGANKGASGVLGIDPTFNLGKYLCDSDYLRLFSCY